MGGTVKKPAVFTAICRFQNRLASPIAENPGNSRASKPSPAGIGRVRSK
jgi:hypothetical protein